MKKIMPFLMTTLAALSFAVASPSQSMAADTVQPVQRAAMSEAEAGAGMFGREDRGSNFVAFIIALLTTVALVIAGYFLIKSL